MYISISVKVCDSKLPASTDWSDRASVYSPIILSERERRGERDVQVILTKVNVQYL